MKKHIRVILPLLLCVVLLCHILPGTASAFGNLTFSTFKQLKSFAAESYETPTWLTYIGTGPLIIVDDLTLPAHLNLDARSTQLTVPSNVEFSAPSSYLLCDTARVSGKMTSSYLSVTKKLTVEGTLTNRDLISLTPETSVSGTNRITHTGVGSGISCLCPVKNFSDLKKYIAAAESNQDPHWTYLLELEQKIQVSESLTVPENCELSVGAELTVAKDQILDLNCRSWLYSKMTVNGTLINRGQMNVQYSEGGSVALSKNGTYLSEGRLICYSTANDSLAKILPGFDTENYLVTTTKVPLFSRILRDECSHKIKDFVPAVTIPTCTEQGYTTYACPKCEAGYVRDLTPPTGKHTYSDDYDSDCNICGAAREVPLKTAPLFRLYNPYTLEHLFTSNPEERDMLANVGWIFEGIAWYVPDFGIPVYRLYNPYDDWHTYTTSSEEIDLLLPLGWQVDGVMCYSTAPGLGEPVVRLFNPYEQKNYHHYTISKDECDMLVPLGWILEGPAWSGIPE